MRRRTTPRPLHSPLHSLRLALAAALALLLTACGAAGGSGGGSDASGKDDRPLVLTTFTVLADMAQNVAGDHLRVESITKPGAEIHEYEPTPEDLKKAGSADLVLANGMGLESWLGQFLQDAQAEHVTVSNGVEPLNIAQGDYEGRPNPHAWMSPRAAQTYVNNMADAFAELDPEHAEDFRRNAEDYNRQLEEVQQDLTEALDQLPEEHRTLLTCEGAFSYLARDAGLKERYLWAVNQEDQGTAQQLTEAIETVREQKIPAVFCESTVSDQTMQQVVDSTDARFGGTLYVDSLSEEGGPVPTFLDLLRHDARTISEGLRGESA